MEESIIDLIKPPALKHGDTIGIFSPSWPGSFFLREKYQIGIEKLKSLGLNVVEGELIKRNLHEGYRLGTARERADEFNSLYRDPEVKGLISAIGGYCSGSILPYLDYDYIKANPKIVCGYSDITTLHCALNKMCHLATFYGPAVISSFGETTLSSYTMDSWCRQVGLLSVNYPLELQPPEEWTNEFVDATKQGWQQIEKKLFAHGGWEVVNEGQAYGSAFACNLNTLLSLAGTPYWPDLKNRILFLEQMNVSLSQEERQLNQLKLLGVFDEIKALVISRPENYNDEGSPLSYVQLLSEITAGKLNYPVIVNFDCGHTVPMLTIPQGAMFKVECDASEAKVIQYSSGVTI